MVFFRRVLILFFCSFFISKGNAQIFNPFQKKTFKAVSDTLVLDSLSIVPGSLKFSIYPQIDTLYFPEVNYKLHALIFSNKKLDSLVVWYKRFPYNFEKIYFHKNSSVLYSDLSKPNNPFTINYNNSNLKQDYLLQNDGLNKNGNISRGISFGNNQDVVVNSNLNLQVSGKLTPEIDMVMAATDNNIPFQADGTTAQLQEFDKVFVQLNNSTSKLVVGDYQLSRPQNSYFMSFYKRAQGAYFENSYLDSNSKKNNFVFKTQVAGAVSRGKFSRQLFFGVENNQGPYRLRGADNEPFIIVLSGTEKIYIDGKLLLRGQENDYTIDYNTGELTFTAKQIMTKDKRVVAEFQYAERNYARSLFFFGEEIQNKKTNVFFNVYSEQDNKNKPLQQTLSQQQKNVLIAIGDTLEKAVYSGVEISAFNNTDVFYKRVDTLINGIIYNNVYVYSINSDSAKYRLKFSNVGAGKGNYNQVSSTANGRVYKWFAPVNGVMQGSYEPVVPLVTPKQIQMLTGGLSQTLTANNSFSIEGVYTKNDLNTFSRADKGNDEGAGVKIISKNQSILKTDSAKNQTKLSYNIGYEYLQKTFHQIERFRSIEFERDWNRPLTSVLLNDQSLASAELGLVTTKGSALVYAVNFFDEGTIYKGIKHNASIKHQLKSLSANYAGSFLTTINNESFQNTEFYRHKILLQQRLKKLKFSYSDEFENNLFKFSSDRMLLPKAYQFWEWEGSIANADSSKNNVKLFYKERRDKLAYNNRLLDSTFATNIGLQTSIYSIKNNPLTVLFTYRKLELKNVVSNSLKPDNTVLSRLEYNPRYLKGLISSSIFYETGYGLENKKEFYYLEVAPGQGQYAWNDYNGNDVKEINEFEIAQFSDRARFIRIYTPTNQYVKVLQNQLSVSVFLRPASLFKDPTNNFIYFLNRWVTQTVFRVDGKMTDKGDVLNFNPLTNVSDTNILASNNNIRQSVLFNQSSAVFGADYTYINNQSKQLLVNGIEQRTLLSHEIKARLNLLKSWVINSSAIYSNKGNNSQFFSNRNYLIESYETEQRLIFQPNTFFRLSSIYKYNQKQNKIEGGFQTAFINTFAAELKYNQSEKGSLTGRLDLILIKFNDTENSSVAYEMLNALSKGQNVTWELNYQRNLNSNIQISINYNGRKTSGSNIVHLGGAQIRAFF